MSEEWRPIEGWPYEVSNEGRVRRGAPARGGFFPAGLVLSPRENPNGYLTVGLWKDGRHRIARVHQLVMAAFGGPKPADATGINHKNGTKTDNRFDNLEYANPREQMQHASRTGLVTQGEDLERSRLNSVAVAVMRFMARRGVAVTRLSRLHRVSNSTARNAITGVTWRHVSEPLTPAELASAWREARREARRRPEPA